MTDAELSALEAAAKAATPGPWEDLSNHPDHLRGVVNKGEKHIALCGYLDTWEEERRVTLKEMLANAAYIAATNPAVVLELIEELRQTRKERDWLAEHIIKYGDTCPSEEVWEKCTAEEAETHLCTACWLQAAKEATLCHNRCSIL